MRTFAFDHDHRREQATAGRVAHRRETGFGFGVVPDRGTHRRQECALRLLGRGMRTAPDIIIGGHDAVVRRQRSEEHTSELQSLMRISYAVFCLKKKKATNT